MDEVKWFYLDGDKRHGPLTIAELTGALWALDEPRSTQIWKQGLPTWSIAGDIPELASHLPPPVPPSARVESPYQSRRADSQEDVSPVPLHQHEIPGSDPRTDGPVGIGGWLLFLCVGLTILNPLRALVDVADLMKMSRYSSSPVSEFLLLTNVIVIAMAVLSFAAGVSLWTRSPTGTGLTKWFLWCQPAGALILALWGGSIGLPAESLNSFLAATVVGVILAAIWTAYLNRSKRVANTYGPKRPGAGQGATHALR